MGMQNQRQNASTPTPQNDITNQSNVSPYQNQHSTETQNQERVQHSMPNPHLAGLSSGEQQVAGVVDPGTQQSFM